MADEIAKNAAENPYHKPQRFTQLIGEFDKHIKLLHDRRKDMNQKATWTLATATSFIAILGLLKDTRINDTASTWIRDQLTVSVVDYTVIVLVVLFAATYLALLYFVTKVYSPQSVGYPLNPIKSKYWAQDETQHDRNIWDGLLDTYVNPDDLEYSRIVLNEQTDAIKNQQKLEEELTENLFFSFKLLRWLALFSVSILILN